VSAPAADRGTRSPRFTESVDWADGRVRTTGRLTSAAADLLAGTTEQLRLAGHVRITVERPSSDADEAGRSALRALAAELGAHHCQLVVLWEETENRL